jgi:signal transduction histidine kinase
MKTKKLIKIPFLKNFLLMVNFGFLSLVMGLVRFDIPGLEGVVSTLGEVPLLISIFHISNPIYLIGTAFISAFSTPADGSFLTTFIMHTGGMVIIRILYQKLKNLQLKSYVFGGLWIICSFFYYLLFIVLLVLTNYLVGLNTDKDFLNFFVDLILVGRYEAIGSAVISSLYLVQHTIRIELVSHQQNLELLVNQRTKELTTAIEELKSTQDHLVQSEKMASLGTLSAGIAHEINNPLNFIQGGVLALELNMDEADLEKNSMPLNAIKTGVQRATDIVTSLNQFSHNSNSLDETINLNDIVHNCLIMIQNETKNRISFELNLCNQKYLLLGNEGRMHQALLNVLLNALQAIENEGIISIETYFEKEYIHLIIIDNGSGIEEENLSKITEPFFTTKSPGKGTGLGLSITYSIIKEHGGSLNFESEPGIGTKVNISLPIDSNSVKTNSV